MTMKQRARQNDDYRLRPINEDDVIELKLTKDEQGRWVDPKGRLVACRVGRFTVGPSDLSPEEMLAKQKQAIHALVDMALAAVDAKHGNSDNHEKSGRLDESGQDDPKPEYSLST